MVQKESGGLLGARARRHVEGEHGSLQTLRVGLDLSHDKGVVVHLVVETLSEALVAMIFADPQNLEGAGEH